MFLAAAAPTAAAAPGCPDVLVVVIVALEVEVEVEVVVTVAVCETVVGVVSVVTDWGDVLLGVAVVVCLGAVVVVWLVWAVVVCFGADVVVRLVAAVAVSFGVDVVDALVFVRSATEVVAAPVDAAETLVDVD